LSLVDSPHTEYIGGRYFKDGVMHADEVTEFIEREATGYLDQLGADETGWNLLYRDRRDGRYWEMTYPQSSLQGGGPPALRLLAMDEVRSRFGHLLGEPPTLP
jgi:hypothetical protein